MKPHFPIQSYSLDDKAHAPVVSIDTMTKKPTQTWFNDKLVFTTSQITLKG